MSATQSWFGPFGVISFAMFGKVGSFDHVGGDSLVVEGAGFELLDPDADQVP